MFIGGLVAIGISIVFTIFRRPFLEYGGRTFESSDSRFNQVSRKIQSVMYTVGLIFMFVLGVYLAIAGA